VDRKLAVSGIAMWLLFAAALLAAPLLPGGATISLLSQIGTAMIFGLSYNMLLGQGGMLSFGHAVYSGMGAFCTAHALNLAGIGAVEIPVTLMPLVGGLAGMAFGIVSGYVLTKKSGTTFAMITLGLVELVFASTLVFPQFFGGEGGISTNRVIAPTVLGVDYGSQREVYYLIALWLFLSTAAMAGFTATPLGRLINAVRDNHERVQSIGFDPQYVRYLTLILSAFFAGIAGALSAIDFESVSAESVSATRSGAILLFTIIGGAGFFIGPMVGALIGVLLTVALSDITPAWHLYLGLFFMLIVRYAPGGITGVLALHLPLAKSGRLGRVLPWQLAIIAASLMAVVAIVLMIEMLYWLSHGMADHAVMQVFGLELAPARGASWYVAIALLIAGVVGFYLARPNFQRVWHTAHHDLSPDRVPP